MLSKLQVKSLLAGPLEDFINPLAVPSIVSFENNGFRSFTFDKALSEHHVKAMEALLDPDYMKNEEQKLMDLSPVIQQFKQAVESQDPKEVKNAQLACLASAIFHWLATDLVESAQLGFRRAQAAEKERFLELLDQGDPLYLVLHADDVRSYEETANALQNIFAPSPSEDGTRNWSPALFYFENISEMRQLAKTFQATGELVVQGNLEILAREMELKTVVPYLTEQAKAQGSSEGELEAGVNKLLDNMAKNPDLHDYIARGLVHMTTEMEKHWLHGRIMTRAELYLEQQAIALVQWLQILADDEDPNFCLVMAHSLRQEQHLVPLLQEDFSLGPRFTKPWHQLLTTITKKASPDFSLKLGRSYMAVYDTLIEQYAIQGRGVQAHSVFGLSEHFLSNTDCVQDLIDNHSLLPRLSQWIADYVKRDGHQEPWKRLESEEYVTLKYDRYSPILTDVDHLSKLECFTSRIECPLLKGVADIMVHNASGQSCCNTMEKDYEKAILEYSDALDLTVSHLGQDHPLAVAWQYSIGWCIYGKGDHPAALEKFGEALELSKTALGYLTNPLTATIQVDIGRVHSSLGDYGTSLAAHEAALSLREKVLGDSHIETARSYCEVAGVLRRQGAADNDGRHVALYRQALDVFEKEPNLAGETASIMSLLAAALAEQGDHSGAIEQHRKALTLCVSIHGEDHLETANIHGNLANALKDAGDFEGAMTEYRAGLQIRRSCLDASNPAIGTSLNNIGLLLHENGRYDEALVELKKAIDIYVSSLGPDHPETANAHFNCGLVLWKLQMHDESLAEHRTALAAYSSSGNEPGIAKTLDEIGWALIEMEDLDAALTEYQKLYTVRLSMLGEDHPDTMEVKQIVLDLRGEVPAISNEIDAEQDDGSATTVDATVDTDQVEVVDSDKDLLGVSVHHLQHGLLHEVKEAGLSRESKIYEIEDLRYPAHGVIRRKGASVTCPIDGQLGASYVHSLGDDPDKVGPSHFMISYSWGYCIGDIVDTLVSYCDEQNRDPKSTYIWICCLCVNQHRVQGEDVLPDELASIFGRRVTGIGHVLSMITPWKEPENLGRIWCVFELFKAHTMGCEVTIVMPAKEKVSLESDLLGDEPGSGVELLYGAIAKTKIEEASTSKVADRIAILGWVEEHLGYSELNRQVNQFIRHSIHSIIALIFEAKTAQLLLSPGSNDGNFLDFARCCMKVGELMARDGRSSFASRVFELGRQVSEKVDIEKARAEAVDDLLGYSPETIECALAKVAMEEVNARILSASVQMQSGELEGAITEFLAAFDIYESQPVLQSREFCTKHSNVGAACLGGIGLAWRIIGSLEFALKFFRAAVSEQERVFGDALEREHLEAIVLYKKNIGEILEELGETDNAQLEYQECLSSTVGGDKRDASDLVDTGGLRVKLGDLDGALKAFMEALAICESENRDQDLQAAQIHLEVARVLEQKGDFAGSLQSFEKALTIKRILYGEEHSEVATIYIDIGSLQESHDRHDDALASFGKSLDIMEAPKYADYPQLACAVAHKRIGFLLEKQGDLEAAAKSFAIASSINQKLGRISIDGDGVGSSDVPTACALEQSRPPCTHYERNCTMIAPCCGAAFGCRICHDECPNLPPKMELQSASLSSTTEEQDTHHNIDRFAVKEIICRVCSARQSSKTNNCIKCGIQFGEYHCSVCNLWTSQEKQPFHCAGCGFCRVGGAENFHHCHDCAMCIRQSDYASHKCQNDKYKSNCPVCQKWLFNSLGDLHEMSCCGHPIHLECFQQLPDSSTCPVCLCQPQGTQAQPESAQTVDLLTQFRVLVSNPTLEVSTVSYFLELCKKDVEAAVALYLSQSQDM